MFFLEDRMRAVYRTCGRNDKGVQDFSLIILRNQEERDHFEYLDTVGKKILKRIWGK
jgi:hypothetical protein